MQGNLGYSSQELCTKFSVTFMNDEYSGLHSSMFGTQTESSMVT